MTEWIEAGWPAPATVRAVSTLRRGGCSDAPWDGLNLAAHVGDDERAVAANRAALATALQLPSMPCWLHQVHGTAVARFDRAAHSPAEADAGVTGHTGVVCAVLTADCLPVLFCDREGGCVGAAHAGWRGLVAGVLESTVEAMDRPADALMAWLGPAIGPSRFEVGEEVRRAFVDMQATAAVAFQPAGPGKWMADLYALARLRLEAIGIVDVYGGGECTMSDSERFYSYRRDGRTGRMATLVWMDTDDA